MKERGAIRQNGMNLDNQRETDASVEQTKRNFDRFSEEERNEEEKNKRKDRKANIIEIDEEEEEFGSSIRTCKYQDDIDDYSKGNRGTKKRQEVNASDWDAGNSDDEGMEILKTDAAVGESKTADDRSSPSEQSFKKVLVAFERNRRESTPVDDPGETGDTSGSSGNSGKAESVTSLRSTESSSSSVSGETYGTITEGEKSGTKKSRSEKSLSNLSSCEKHRGRKFGSNSSPSKNSGNELESLKFGSDASGSMGTGTDMNREDLERKKNQSSFPASDWDTNTVDESSTESSRSNVTSKKSNNNRVDLYPTYLNRGDMNKSANKSDKQTDNLFGSKPVAQSKQPIRSEYTGTHQTTPKGQNGSGQQKIGLSDSEEATKTVKSDEKSESSDPFKYWDIQTNALLTHQSE